MVSGTHERSHLKEQAEGRETLEMAGNLLNLELRPSDKLPLTGPYLLILP